ncbi:class I SAM-dependent methyltransferase, partial [Candidatus Sumerlaeota bacterium]|nr:class I SAM-dependent methyltransferase [Candidatus Sumerlaeota bacterium]
MADAQEPTDPISRLDRARIEETAASIPRTVRSILDAGSGHGWLSNKLADDYDVTAVDYNLDSLSHVTGRKAQADVAHLPFGDASFDMVCCCETLEHLDDRQYRLAVREIARVARRYALITVPNEEDLASLYTKCPRCGTKFSPYGHVRSFSARDLPGLFAAQGVGAMKCLAVKGIVPVKVWRQSKLLLQFRPERVGFWLRRTPALHRPSTATCFLRACLKTDSTSQKEREKPVIASEAKQSPALFEGLLRRFAPRNDGVRGVLRHALRKICSHCSLP